MVNIEVHVDPRYVFRCNISGHPLHVARTLKQFSDAFCISDVKVVERNPELWEAEFRAVK
jgi:hypothetical protein